MAYYPNRKVFILSSLGVLGLSIVAVAYFHNYSPGILVKQAPVISNAALPVHSHTGIALYPYSVILGGVRSRQELKIALTKDEVARSHYAGFEVEKAHVVPATPGMLRYVSYRKNNRVFWTRKALRIPSGELLLTEGKNFARARCGNRLSAVRMLPVEAQPPPSMVDDSDTLDFAFDAYPPADFALPALTEEAALIAPRPDESGPERIIKAVTGAGESPRTLVPLTTGGAAGRFFGFAPRSVTGAAAVDTPEPAGWLMTLVGLSLVLLVSWLRLRNRVAV